MLPKIKYPPATRGKLVLWSLMATYPFGGMTWHRLHYLAGLRQMGFDVWYVEDSDRPVYSPDRFWPSKDYQTNIAYLARQMERIGLERRWVFREPGVYDRCYGGLDIEGLKQLYREADAVLNLSGAQELRDIHGAIRCLVYIETDPVANQVNVANGRSQIIQTLSAHHHIFTYGMNIGAPDCRVPVTRFKWHPARPPVIMEWWRDPRLPDPGQAFTTVAGWRHSGKDVSFQGATYHWSKQGEFLRFANVPQATAHPLEIAVVGIEPKEQELMRNKGWQMSDATQLADPMVYRDYIRNSYGEFTIAKEQYVAPRSGWFSDRSVCYLAAGRPVITQDTGFGNIVPTGRGVFSFCDQKEALAAIETIEGDYPYHSRAAVDIAQEYFSAEKVLGNLISQIGL